MARRHFILPNVAANARVRIDTASGTTSPADIVNDSGLAVAGAILHADGSGFLGDEIYGPVDGTKTLYVKTLNDSDAVTATATLSASHSGQVTAAQLESRVAALEEGGSAASSRLSWTTVPAQEIGGEAFLTFEPDNVDIVGSALVLDPAALDGVTVAVDSYVTFTLAIKVRCTPVALANSGFYVSVAHTSAADPFTWLNYSESYERHTAVAQQDLFAHVAGEFFVAAGELLHIDTELDGMTVASVPAVSSSIVMVARPA